MNKGMPSNHIPKMVQQEAKLSKIEMANKKTFLHGEWLENAFFDFFNEL